jgi:hypothetical protein
MAPRGGPHPRAIPPHPGESRIDHDRDGLVIPAVTRLAPCIQRRSVLALILALMLVSGHYAGLQLLAWSGMLAARVQTRTLGDAVRSTFDGSEPCRLCQAVTALEAMDHAADQDRNAAPGKPAKPGQQDPTPELMPGTGWSPLPAAPSPPPPDAIVSWAIPASAVLGLDPPPPRA